MNLNTENIRDLIEFCGGDSTMLDDWKDEIKNREVKTLDELINYPFKNEFDWMFSPDEQENIPHLYIFTREQWDSDGYGRHQIMTLDDVITHLEENNYSEEYKKNIHKDLIKIKFGSMCFDW